MRATLDDESSSSSSASEGEAEGPPAAALGPPPLDDVSDVTLSSSEDEAAHAPPHPVATPPDGSDAPASEPPTQCLPLTPPIAMFAPLAAAPIADVASDARSTSSSTSTSSTVASAAPPLVAHAAGSRGLNDTGMRNTAALAVSASGHSTPQREPSDPVPPPPMADAATPEVLDQLEDHQPIQPRVPPAPAAVPAVAGSGLEEFRASTSRLVEQLAQEITALEQDSDSDGSEPGGAAPERTPAPPPPAPPLARPSGIAQAMDRRYLEARVAIVQNLTAGKNGDGVSAAVPPKVSPGAHSPRSSGTPLKQCTATGPQRLPLQSPAPFILPSRMTTDVPTKRLRVQASNGARMTLGSQDMPTKVIACQSPQLEVGLRSAVQGTPVSPLRLDRRLPLPTPGSVLDANKIVLEENTAIGTDAGDTQADAGHYGLRLAFDSAEPSHGSQAEMAAEIWELARLEKERMRELKQQKLQELRHLSHLVHQHQQRYAAAQAQPAAGLPDDEELRAAIQRLLWLTQETEDARAKQKVGDSPAPTKSAEGPGERQRGDARDAAGDSPPAATAPALRGTTGPSAPRATAAALRAFHDVTNRKAGPGKPARPKPQSPKAPCAIPDPGTPPLGDPDPDPVPWREFYRQADTGVPGRRVGSRLYNQGLLLQRLRDVWASEERRRLERRGRRREGCTFAPQISDLARASTRPSGVTGAVLGRKEECPAVEPECTFQPRLNPQSLCLVSAKVGLDEERGLASHERLYLENARRQQRREELEEAAAPRPRSEEGGQGRPPPSAEALDRLVYSRQTAEATIGKVRANLQRVQERTLFRPRVLARERPRDTSPPGADCFDKLYAKAMAAWQEKEQQLEQQERELREAANVGKYVNRTSAHMVEQLRHGRVLALFRALDVNCRGGFTLEEVRQVLVQASAPDAPVTLVAVGRQERPLQALLVELLPLLEASGHQQFDLATFTTVCAAMPQTGPSPYLMPGKRRRCSCDGPGDGEAGAAPRRASLPEPAERHERHAASEQAEGAKPKPPAGKRAQPRVAELHRERQEWAEKAAQRKVEREAAELRQCTFQPNVDRRRAKPGPRPPGSAAVPGEPTAGAVSDAPGAVLSALQGQQVELVNQPQLGSGTPPVQAQATKFDVPASRVSVVDGDTFNLSDDEDGDESADDDVFLLPSSILYPTAPANDLPIPAPPIPADTAPCLPRPHPTSAAPNSAPMWFPDPVPLAPAATESSSLEVMGAPAAALRAAPPPPPPRPAAVGPAGRCGLPPRGQSRRGQRVTAQMALVLEASESDPPALDAAASAPNGWDIGQFGARLMQRQLADTALLDQLCAALAP